MAPSLRFAQVSPRPPAAYALRHNDLNRVQQRLHHRGEPARGLLVPSLRAGAVLTTPPTAASACGFTQVEKEDQNLPNYRFANQTLVSHGLHQPMARRWLPRPQTLALEPYVRMEAGEPVIPFYPLGVVIGASPLRPRPSASTSRTRPPTGKTTRAPAGRCPAAKTPGSPSRSTTRWRPTSGGPPASRDAWPTIPRPRKNKPPSPSPATASPSCRPTSAP
jgi:hypothetical protein